MVQTCVDSALHQLSELQAFHHGLDAVVDYSLYFDIGELLRASLGELDWYLDPFERILEIDAYWEEIYLQVQSYKRELMFLKMILWCFATCEDTYANLRPLLTTLEGMWEDLEEFIDDTILWKPEPVKQDWDLLASFLEGTIQQFKPLIIHYCHVSSDSSMQGKPLPSEQNLLFLQLVLHNVEILVSHKADIIPPVKMQIDSLKLRLILLQNFFRLITAHEGINCEELRVLKLCLQTFANDAASQVFLFWAKSANEQITFEAKINQLLSDMEHNIIKPCGSDVTALYLGALKAIKLQPSDDPLLYEEVVVGFVDLHLDNLVSASKDDRRIVREGLIFLLTFVSDPPEGCEWDEQLALICKQIDLLFSKCTYLILSPPVIMKEHFTLEKMLLDDFAEKLEETMKKVKQLFVQIPDPSSYNFPSTNGLGFYDFLLQKLERSKEKLDSNATFTPLAKKFIITIEEELLSLRLSVNAVFDLQKEEKEFEETWSKVFNLAYQIEHVINSCLMRCYPVWYKMACLSDILDQIEDVKRKLEKVGNCKMNYAEVLTHSLQPSTTPLERTRSEISSEEVISLEEETRDIIDELMSGYKSLGTISIIGMGGLGKTTLAKKVFYSKLVRSHFHKLAFCNVSQVHNTRNLFIDILCGIINCDKDQFDSMTEDDLAHSLWKCLSGQKYMIVMDDIWDVRAWNEVKKSFPDDKNGSRVIFTTRERKVASDAKSSFHDLRPRSADESFKLLHVKVFGKEDCSPIFSKVGKIIAKNCKGLPLSIIVVAGLLASNKTSISWWEEIAETTSQFVGQECKDIIGLSYKHLPEHLKSCFLYMGIYGQDKLICAEELRMLWIGEGFVNKSMTKSSRIVAKEYLNDLVDRSLLTATKRSGRGGIKTCRLHDLIRDFCQRQAEEDNFLWVKDGYAASNSSNSRIHNQYRVSIKMGGGSFDDVEPIVLENMHSLLCRDKDNIPEFIWGSLKLVQVLHLEGSAEGIFFHHLIHLRYIYINPRNWLWEVPESICNLLNLETFIVVSVLSNMKLPKTVWKMKRLRHLDFPHGCELDVDDDDHEGHHHLLDNIEFISNLYLYDERTAKAVLRRVPNIQKLTCSLEGSQWTGKVFTIDFLGNLESLSLRRNVRVPAVFFPPSLKRVDLCFWFRNEGIEDIVSAIGRLPCLEALKIYGSLKRWDVKDGQFHKLIYLYMWMEELEQWNVSFESFSCLQRLELSHCKSLEELPACFTELSTLQRIKVEECNDKLKSSAIQVEKEQKESGNQVQLEIREKRWIN